MDLGVLARHRRRGVVRKLARVCEVLLDKYHNVSYDVNTNGEAAVLRALASFGPRTVFDVGANVGDWAQCAVSSIPTATIHAFEIAPRTVEDLRRRLSDVPRVEINALGLGRQAGTITIRYSPDDPALTTATSYPHQVRMISMEAAVTTGDRYMAERGVAHVDLLKLDVEGMEADVLDGFEQAFARNAIDVVQFEYGRVNLLTGVLLRDLYARFERLDFAVGKIYPEYVDFRGYDLLDEDFRGPNYLAVRRARADLLSALRG